MCVWVSALCMSAGRYERTVLLLTHTKWRERPSASTDWRCGRPPLFRAAKRSYISVFSKSVRRHSTHQARQTSSSRAAASRPKRKKDIERIRTIRGSLPLITTLPSIPQYHLYPAPTNTHTGKEEARRCARGTRAHPNPLPQHGTPPAPSPAPASVGPRRLSLFSASASSRPAASAARARRVCVQGARLGRTPAPPTPAPLPPTPLPLHHTTPQQKTTHTTTSLYNPISWPGLAGGR